MTLGEIIELARAYAAARRAVQDVVDAIQEDHRAAVASRLTALTAATADMKAARGPLVEAIRAHPGLFAKPRTQDVYGLRFGLRSKQGDVSYDSEDELVTRIRRTMTPELARQLIVETATVSTPALRKLAPADLERIGVKIGAGGDDVTISAHDASLDRIIAGLLSDSAVEA